MRRTLLAAVLILAGGGPVWAEGFGFLSGEQLLKNCQSKEMRETGSCQNYVSGAVDTMQLTQRLTMACMFIPPEGLTKEQAVGVVLEYLKAHPEELWMSGARNVIAAMASEYPCSR